MENELIVNEKERKKEKRKLIRDIVFIILFGLLIIWFTGSFLANRNNIENNDNDIKTELLVEKDIKYRNKYFDGMIKDNINNSLFGIIDSHTFTYTDKICEVSFDYTDSLSYYSTITFAYDYLENSFDYLYIYFYIESVLNDVYKSYNYSFDLLPYADYSFDFLDIYLNVNYEDYYSGYYSPNIYVELEYDGGSDIINTTGSTVTVPTNLFDGSILYIDSIYYFDMYEAFSSLTSIYQTCLEYGSNGYSSGYDVGLDDGYDRGYVDGLDDGYYNGYETGINEGLADGYREGYDIGYDSGYENGYREGDFDGYEAGYLVGITDLQKENLATTGFKTLFNAILNAPYNIFKGILNFEFLGINLFSLFSFIFTTMLILWVVKIFKK